MSETPPEPPSSDRPGAAPTVPRRGWGQPPPGWGQPPSAPMGYYGPPAPRSSNGMAIASLVLGIAGLLTCGLSGLVGLVLGYVGRRQIREGNGTGDGMALAGIVLGWIWVGLIALYLVLVFVGLARYAGS